MDTKCDYCDELLIEWDYITNCGHTLCASCYRLDTKKCLLCKKQCEYRLIGEKMNANGTKFLSPISRVLNDAKDIVDFQMSSLLRLVSFLRDKVERQRILLQQVKQELGGVKEFKWELHHLREENEQLKNKLKKQKQVEYEKQKEEEDKHQQGQEEGQEYQEEEQEEESKEDHGSYLYYHPLAKEDFSSQELRVWKCPDPFSFQSRVNELNYQHNFI